MEGEGEEESHTPGRTSLDRCLPVIGQSLIRTPMVMVIFELTTQLTPILGDEMGCMEGLEHRLNLPQLTDKTVFREL